MTVVGGDEEPPVPDEALQLLASWTGSSELPFLRAHVLSFWRDSRAKHHTYKCIQELASLILASLPTRSTPSSSKPCSGTVPREC